VKRSNQIHLLQNSISVVTQLLFRFNLINVENRIGDGGAIKLAEALKSNASLASLSLSGNGFISSIHSHSIQGMILVLLEAVTYVKHSNQIHP
jgi:hypothetical protein